MMLWDPKHDVKLDPMSLDTLIAWLEKQPKDEAYCYNSNGACLLAQYFEAMAFECPWVGIGSVHFGVRDEFWECRGNIALPDGFNSISFQKPHTFGAALKRARKLQEERK